MKAFVADSYKPPEILRIEEVGRPVPFEDEVFVHVQASTVTRSDFGFGRASRFFSRVFAALRRPKPPLVDMELAGLFEVVCSAVTEFQVGDEIMGLRCGANAETVCQNVATRHVLPARRWVLAP